MVRGPEAVEGALADQARRPDTYEVSVVALVAAGPAELSRLCGGRLRAR
jgi:hypothetical protein